MEVHKIDIDGTVYGNVGNIETKSEPVYYHNIETLDGKTHQSLRYYKTTHTVTLFNLLNGQYLELRNFVLSHKSIAISCGFPNDEDSFIYDDYFLEYQGEINKGYLNGKYFRNGLEIKFTKVNADE